MQQRVTIKATQKRPTINRHKWLFLSCAERFSRAWNEVDVFKVLASVIELETEWETNAMSLIRFLVALRCVAFKNGRSAALRTVSRCLFCCLYSNSAWNWIAARGVRSNILRIGVHIHIRTESFMFLLFGLFCTGFISARPLSESCRTCWPVL